jgi:hypothetical protein
MQLVPPTTPDLCAGPVVTVNLLGIRGRWMLGVRIVAITGVVLIAALLRSKRQRSGWECEWPKDLHMASGGQ